jgi:hypothetical protein
MKALQESPETWNMIDWAVSSLDFAVRAGRIPNPLVAASSQTKVRGALRIAAVKGNLYADDEWLIFAEPGKVWFSDEPVLFENLVYPLTGTPVWRDVPRLLRGIARLHGARHVLFGDMFGVAAPHYRKAAGVKALGRSFITTL